jgi:hypothetical protein
MDVSPQDHSKYILVKYTPEPDFEEKNPLTQEETIL